MRIKKEQKQKLKTAEVKFNKILDACENDFDKMIDAMKVLYTHLTGLKGKELEEANSKYNITDIANSVSLSMKKRKVTKGLGFEHNFIVSPEIYLYDKAPNEIIYLIAIFDYNFDKKCPIKIDMFVEKEV